MFQEDGGLIATVYLGLFGASTSRAFVIDCECVRPYEVFRGAYTYTDVLNLLLAWIKQYLRFR